MLRETRARGGRESGRLMSLMIGLLVALLVALAASFAPQRAWAFWYDEGWGAAGVYDDSWYHGTGSYTLSTASQLAGLAHLVNVEGVTFAGCTVSLANDIDLSGYEWAPIGYASTGGGCFSGTFDGRGHTVSGLTITGTGHYKALFGYVRGALVENLVVRGSVQGSFCVAGVVAYSSQSSFRELANYANVTSTGAITDQGTYNGSAAGVVCYAATTDSAEPQYFENLYNFGTITAAGKDSGGVIGFIMSRDGVVNISQCANYGPVNVNATQNVDDPTDGIGGVVGATAGYGTYQISECVNTGAVTTANMYSTGGIVGQLGGAGSFVSYSYNTGAINGATTAGGIVGNINASGGQVASCYNAGLVNGAVTAGVIGSAQGADPSAFAVNNFYLDGTAAGAFGSGADADGAGLGLSKGELGSDETLGVLNAQNDVYAHGAGGLPVLGWQVGAVAGGGVRGPVAPSEPSGPPPQQGSSVIEADPGPEAGGQPTAPEAGPSGSAGDAGSESGGGAEAGVGNQTGGASEAASGGSAAPSEAAAESATAPEAVEATVEAAEEPREGTESSLHLIELEDVPEAEEDFAPPVPVSQATVTAVAALAVGCVAYGSMREYSRFSSQSGGLRRASRMLNEPQAV